jgi:G6PDH family F420-dependent oxidoreductase
MELGVAFSSEELDPNEIVRSATLAEEVGFTTAWVSDHFHPWIDAQGESPFVWSVLGGIAHATERLRIGTGVTCPIMRIHPAILAQAAATTQCMCGGRFWFGVGSART